MATSEMRVGVVGLRRGLAHAAVFAQFEGVRVVAGCDVSAEARVRATERFGLAATYDEYAAFLGHDLDIVVVASPPMLHAAHSIAALESGRHVLCEVPLVYDVRAEGALAQAQSLVTAVYAAERRSGARFMFAENTNYWWFVQDWRQRILEGQLGRLLYAEAEYVHNCRAIMRDADGSPTWRASMPPLFYCTHSLGPVLHWLGERVVRAVGMTPGSHVAPEFPAPDIEVGLFTAERGAVVKLLCGFKVEREPAHHHFCLYGTRGSIEWLRNQTRAVAHFAGDGPKRMQEIPFSLNYPDAPSGATVGGHGTCEHFMVADFLRAVRRDEAPPIGVFEGLEMTLPGVYAHLSATRGSVPLEIPDVRAKWRDEAAARREGAMVPG
jgi:predicted dehydrogenase